MYKKWWPADLHVIGKGIVRFHAIYWPAFLLSAKLKLPKSIFVHEYITIDGHKMSKTLGNVIDPIMLIEKYGADSLRYYFLRYISPFTDGDFSQNKFVESYNADLANGLGNLISRVAKLCEQAKYEQLGSESRVSGHLIGVDEYSEALVEYRFNDALSFVWQKITALDKFINETKPWELLRPKDDQSLAEKTSNSPRFGETSKRPASPAGRLKVFLGHAVDQIQELGALLEPFLPETAKKIEEQFKGPKILSEKPLFPRI